MNRVNLQCAQCGDRHTVWGEDVHRVRHWCWQDDAGLWRSMGWSVDE